MSLNPFEAGLKKSQQKDVRDASFKALTEPEIAHQKKTVPFAEIGLEEANIIPDDEELVTPLEEARKKISGAILTGRGLDLIGEYAKVADGVLTLLDYSKLPAGVTPAKFKSIGMMVLSDLTMRPYLERVVKGIRGKNTDTATMDFIASKILAEPAMKKLMQSPAK